jgi:hypothetical protein
MFSNSLSNFYHEVHEAHEELPFRRFTEQISNSLTISYHEAHEAREELPSWRVTEQIA